MTSAPFSSPLVDPAALDEWERFVDEVLHRPRLEALAPRPARPERAGGEAEPGRLWPAYLLYLGCGVLALGAVALLAAPEGLGAIGDDPLAALGALGEFLALLTRAATGRL